ncbi:MAG TPA: hypothetical protein VN657_06955 [Nitrospiraceae bacterium]|nr:hypothetical protein [Nitrospiraceae bacterium]
MSDTGLRLILERSGEDPPHRASDEHKTGSLMFYQWEADYDYDERMRR